jgi:hypothetical protein
MTQTTPKPANNSNLKVEFAGKVATINGGLELRALSIMVSFVHPEQSPFGTSVLYATSPDQIAFVQRILGDPFIEFYEAALLMCSDVLPTGAITDDCFVPVPHKTFAFNVNMDRTDMFINWKVAALSAKTELWPVCHFVL